jgi:hypothetical protein
MTINLVPERACVVSLAFNYRGIPLQSTGYLLELNPEFFERMNESTDILKTICSDEVYQRRNSLERGSKQLAARVLKYRSQKYLILSLLQWDSSVFSSSGSPFSASEGVSSGGAKRKLENSKRRSWKKR